MTDINALVEELFSNQCSNEHFPDNNTKITLKNSYTTPSIQDCYKCFANEKKATSNSLNWYLKTVDKAQKQIDKSQEQELLNKILEGGRTAEFAKKRLFYLHLDTVIVTASKLKLKTSRKMNINDLIQDGNIGLLKAINTYNKTIKNFTNFAIINIEQVICEKYKIKNF